MTPVSQSMASNICLFSSGFCLSRREIRSNRCVVSNRHSLLSPPFPGFSMEQSALRFVKFKSGIWSTRYTSRLHVSASVETNMMVEGANSSASGEEAVDSGNSLASSDATIEMPQKSNAAATSPPKNKRLRLNRKSEMPALKDEELVPGVLFTGKVKSILPFGIFVDFGAYTDGLVHVSRISDGYVKDVAALFTVGQEVKVKIVEVNKESGRISLTMRTTDDAGAGQQKKSPPSGVSGSEKNKTATRNTSKPSMKREEQQKTPKFVKGQALTGTVKNLTRSGAFISLADGEEGFLPIAEESEGLGGILGNSSLQVGQEVNVRVLRLARGGVTLTMKQEEDVEGINKKLNKGVIHVATNPFLLAFRRNKEISAFLDEKERLEKLAENASASEATPEVAEADSVDDVLADEATTDGALAGNEATSSQSASHVENGEMIGEETPKDSGILKSTGETLVSEANNIVVETKESSSQEVIMNQELSITDNVKEDDSASGAVLEISSTTNEEYTADESVESIDPSQAGNIMEKTLKDGVAEYVAVNQQGDMTSNASLKEERDRLPEDIPAEVSNDSAVDVTSSFDGQIFNAGLESNVVDPNVAPTSQDSSTTESAELFDSSADSVSTLVSSSTISEPEESVSQDESNDPSVESSLVKGDQDQTLGGISDFDVTSQSEVTAVSVDGVKSNIASEEEVSLNKKEAENLAASNVGAETNSKGSISAAIVKQLREETGAGMMDCKKALSETGGDIDKAREFLRKKGLASADKRAGRMTAEGRIGSYVHDNRIGILVEVNCETDFVSRNEIFKELVDDLAMQVAACPQVTYLSTEDVPEEITSKEREIEMQKEDLMSKPEQIRAKIVDGRVSKRLEQFALLEQPYIKNDKVLVKDWIKQSIATIGENIKVRRFIRLNLGEGLQKKSQDFAAEVAAQTAAKPVDAASKEKPSESTETTENAPTVAISATLVKQLREETGAGMMDCKKALTESGGDIQKAQEYLRKKGLSSADKKSSRVAAEGIISSYIHDSRIGCLIEVNSETDFVARNEKFKELAVDLAMQVVACPQVQYVSVEDIPESIINKEKEIEMQRDDLQSKPENIREKIVEGRITKRLAEIALLEQAFIRDDGITVKELVKQTVAALGENIKVRRFVRYTLGESTD